MESSRLEDRTPGSTCPEPTVEGPGPSTVEHFAQRLRAEQRARYACENPNLDAASLVVKTSQGPKYTKVDVGTGPHLSGKYMVVNATGEIYGIKAYGVIHRGHAYGTLDTIDQWDWSGYVAVRRNKS